MAHKDAAWHERMYNNRALVPDFAQHFERWRSASAAVRAQRRVHLDAAYGAGVNETLDIFPAERPDAPVVVFIHGGYWRSLDKSEHSFVAEPLLQAGACVVVINYALCPGTPQQPVTVPSIALQCAQALAWVWRHIGAYGGDRDRVRLMGHSAGGHLAAMLLCCDWKRLGKDLPAGLVQQALALSGVYELAPLRHAAFIQADLRLMLADAQACSPTRYAAPKSRALQALVGGDESYEFIRQTQAIGQAWGRAVVPVCEALPGLNHFSILTQLAEPGSRVQRYAQALAAM